MPSTRVQKDKAPKAPRVYLKKAEEALQNQVFKVRFTECEGQEIREQAKRKKMSIGAYIRAKALDKEVNELGRWGRLGKAIRELMTLQILILGNEKVDKELVKVLKETLDAIKALRKEQQEEKQ